MATTQYKKVVEEMIAKHAMEFEKFGEVHNKFKVDQDKWKKEFDEIGKPLLRIIEDAENRLCYKMEGAGMGKYSGNVSEKFRQEVRNRYPLIDLVGVTIS
jgi:hypothetical protein